MPIEDKINTIIDTFHTLLDIIEFELHPVFSMKVKERRDELDRHHFVINNNKEIMGSISKADIEFLVMIFSRIIALSEESQLYLRSLRTHQD